MELNWQQVFTGYPWIIFISLSISVQGTPWANGPQAWCRSRVNTGNDVAIVIYHNIFIIYFITRCGEYHWMC